MATKPWERYGSFSGDPIIAPADPYKQANEQRAQEDQAREADRMAMERERLRLAQDASTRAASKDQQGSVEQGKAASFLVRGIEANNNFEALGGIGPRSIVGEVAAENFPRITNAVSSDERQLADQSERAFIAAILRYDSGAAIPPEEFITNGKIYFPRAGDSEAVLKQKAQARRTALAGLLDASGPAGAKYREALAATPTGTQGDGIDREQARKDSVAWWGEELYDEQGNPLGQEGGQAYNKAGEYVGLTGRVSDTSAYDARQEKIAQSSAKLDELNGKPGIFDLAKQGMTLGLSDEAAGVGTVISEALMGDFDVAENYNRGRDIANYRLDQARERTGWMGTGAEVIGGLASGGIASLPQMTVREAATGGAAAGALGGFGYGEGVEGRTINTVTGAALGGALGGAAQKVGNTIANRAAAKNVAVATGRDALDAADDLGIEVIPAITGGTVTRKLTAGARQGFISDAPIAASVDRMTGQAQAARTKIAQGVGNVTDAADAGETIRSAAKVYSKRTSQIGGNLYTRAYRRAGDTKAPLPEAVAAADRWLADLSQAPGGAESTTFKELTKLREQMASGAFSIPGVRQMRTALREQMTERGLRGTQTDVIYGQIADAAETDMIAALNAAGKQEAAASLKTASDFWRKRVETIDEVLDPLLGKNAPRSGEQILASLERLAKPESGNSARLRKLMEAMPREEAASVRATVINRLGRPGKGAAEKAGEEQAGFSFDTFLTNWNDMSPRAKRTMFPEGTYESLDKLATVAQRAKLAGSSLNRSNTAGAVTVQAAISTPAFWFLEPLTAGSLIAGQYGAGKLLASPRFARLLAGAPKNATAAQQRAWARNLGSVARAEPALAGDVKWFQDAIIKAANDNPGVARSVAEEQDRK